MTPATRIVWWLVGLAVAAGLMTSMYFATQAAKPQNKVERLQEQLANIRGLPFKRPVIVQQQSREDFVRPVINDLQKFANGRDYSEVARMLGLLARDETLDVEDIKQSVTTKSVDSHYDPDSGRLFLVSQSAGAPLGIVEAREIFHALQDQNFDLKHYLPELKQDSALNHDELLARKLVVEGEAFYASVMWSMQYQNGVKPTDALLSSFLSKLKEKERMDEIRDSALMSLRMRASPGDTPSPNRKESGGTPAFISEMGHGMQRDGFTFVDAVRRNGWSAVDKLYKESPPVSTEQVLHPNKWLKNERPVKIQWRDLKTHKLFADWELLAENVLGEFQWRIVFKVNHSTPFLSFVPDGWNGDRYAVFKRRGGDDMLLLMYTLWDTEAAAAAFASSYRSLLEEKYAEKLPPLRILEKGRKVVIVVGGDESSLDSFARFAEAAQEIAPTG